MTRSGGSVRSKILIIDDDREMTELLKIVLEPQSFIVETANTGKEGIELLKQFDPDVVVMDLLMPGMDGFEMCREIRKFSNVPILILSALSKPDMIARALDEGADDYLVKPMKSGVLVAHLNKLVRRSRSGEFKVQTNRLYSS